VSDDKIEERPEEPEAESPETPRRSPFVVTVVFIVLAAVAAAAWLSSRQHIVTVPDVVRTHIDLQTLEPARIAIESRDLLIGEISTADWCPSWESGTVVSQEPTGGAEVSFGTSVDLVVCRE
jgi:beta-lactam-binding protein with PASTA domain